MDVPTVWPPGPDYTPISRYLNSLVMPARDSHNRMRISQGKAAISLSDEDYWNAHYLPRYPDAGGSIPSVIGPWGVKGFGLHEFQGHYEIMNAVDAMNTLARTGTTGTTPTPPPPTTDPGTGLPPGTPPTPPAPIPEPEPEPEPGTDPGFPPCPPGFYRNLFTGECEPDTAQPPPPVVEPPPPTPGTDKLAQAIILAEQLLAVLRS